MEYNMDIAINTFGKAVIVKKVIPSISRELLYSIREDLGNQKITKSLIKQNPVFAFIKRTVDTEDLIKALLNFKYLWNEMIFTDELRLCLVQIDISSLQDLPHVTEDTKLREYVKENNPAWLNYFGDLTKEEFVIYIESGGNVERVENFKTLLLGDREMMDKLLSCNPGLLSLFDFTKEQEFSYLSRSPYPREYEGASFKTIEPKLPEEQYTSTLEPNAIYQSPVRVQADGDGQAILYVEGDVFINPRFTDNGVPICIDTDVRRLVIKSVNGARLILSCPTYCIPIGVPACTGLSGGRWSTQHVDFSLEEILLDNVQVSISSSTNNLPLAGVYGETNTSIKVKLINDASVNGDCSYSQEGYSVHLPYLDGSTKLSSEAIYAKSKVNVSSAVEGF